jgi:AraC-like DNA-binding protein
MVMTRALDGPLSEAVESLWLDEPSVPRPARERILPSGRMQIVINLGSEAARLHSVNGRCYSGPIGNEPIFCGAASAHRIIGLPARDTLVGIAFRGGGAQPFLQPSATLVANGVAALCDVWRSDARRLRERLLRTTDAARRLQALEDFLRVQRPKTRPIHPAVAYAVRELENARECRVAAVASDVGLSPRRFISVFSSHVGLTPKIFQRVSRFQRVVQSCRLEDDVNWMVLALEHGYYDQAHLVHDFKAFSGLTPTAFLRRRTVFANHMREP